MSEQNGNGNGNGAQPPELPAEPASNGKPARKSRSKGIGQGKGGGRPRKRIEEADLDKVEAMAGYGLTEAAIANVLGMSADTFALRKRQQPEVLRRLESGKAVAAAKVGQALFNLATGARVIRTRIVQTAEGMKQEQEEVYAAKPDLGAIVWYEKTRGGRKDPTYAARSGEGEEDQAPDGTPIIPLETLRAAVKRAEARQGTNANGNGKGRLRAI